MNPSDLEGECYTQVLSIGTNCFGLSYQEVTVGRRSDSHARCESRRQTDSHARCKSRQQSDLSGHRQTDVKLKTEDTRKACAELQSVVDHNYHDV